MHTQCFHRDQITHSVCKWNVFIDKRCDEKKGDPWVPWTLQKPPHFRTRQDCCCKDQEVIQQFLDLACSSGNPILKMREKIFRHYFWNWLFELSLCHHGSLRKLVLHFAYKCRWIPRSYSHTATLGLYSTLREVISIVNSGERATSAALPVGTSTLERFEM